MGSKNVYERFLWFDNRARSKKYPNATSLAREFEMSSKTAQRDIEFMRDRLGCPLVYDQTEKGYYYESETFSLPLVYMSSSEFTSLAVARKLLQDLGGGISDEISGAIRKITGVLQKHVAGIDDMDGIVSFHLVNYTPTPETTFSSVLEACAGRRTLTFDYSSPSRKGSVSRTVEPYHLFNYMGTWHLIAFCRLRNGIRDFRLNRIEHITMNDETFSAPQGFDFNRYFDSSFGLYKSGKRRNVVLKFGPDHARWVRDEVWHKDQKQRHLTDGSLELEFPVADFKEIIREIMRHGAGVEVLKPADLRELVRAEADRIAAVYGRSGQVSS